MNSIQQIPFYLPLNVNFDSTQIVASSYHEYSHDEYPWEFNIGSTLSFYDPISKFVVTSRCGDVIKEHMFITINEGGYKSSILYPIAIKTYRIDDKYDRYYPKVLLLKSGISNVLSQIGTILNTKYYFLSKLYLEKALQIYNPNQVDQLMTSLAYKSSLENAYRSLDYINNENSPSILFNFTQYLDDLEYRKIHHVSMSDIFTTNETIDSIIDMFTPKIDYPIIYDQLTMLSIHSERVSPKELISSMIMNNVRENNLAMVNTFVDKILNESHNVIYALNSVIHDELLSFSLYVLYELYQDCPFKEGYIKYILHSNGLEIDLNTLVGNNWYYNLRYDGRMHKTHQLEWMRLLTHEVQCLVEVLRIDNRSTIEIIIQDYHVVMIINNNGYKTSIVFDMIVLILLSKTLFFTEDRYTNDQYCYYPTLTM